MSEQRTAGAYAVEGTTTTSGSREVPAPRRRLTTETKAAYKTSELWIYVAAVAGVLIASQLVGTTRNHLDYFRADRAWLYVIILTVGYLVSRGIAKSGSAQPYDE